MLERDTALASRLWVHHAVQVMSAWKQWSGRDESRQIRPVLHIPDCLTGPDHSGLVWTGLTAAASVADVPLNGLILAVEQPGALFDTSTGFLLNQILQSDVTLMSRNGAGLGHATAQAHPNLIEWTMMDAEVTFPALDGHAGSIAILDDTQRNIEDCELGTKICARVGDTAVTVGQRIQMQQHGITLTVGEPAPLPAFLSA